MAKKLRPKLRSGELSSQEVQTKLVRGFVNYNPATGGYPGLPGGYGFQGFATREQTTNRVESLAKSTKSIFESLDRDGQLNPVLLWARWNGLFISYGMTRCMWAVNRNRTLKALIVDYDNAYEHWVSVPYSRIADKFTAPPVGIQPVAFKWNGKGDYVIDQAEEWVTR